MSFASTEHKFLKRFGIMFDPLSLCRFTGQPKSEIQLSTNALATVFASWF